MQLLEIMQEFGDSVVFVGGWLPYIYTEYYWKTKVVDPIFTEDVDIGIRFFHGHVKTLEQRFSEVDFIRKDESQEDDFGRFQLMDGERKYPIDVITGDPDPGQFNRLAGHGLYVINSLNNFDILTHPENTMNLNIIYNEKKLILRMPKPGTYVYHKGITFEERSLEVKNGYKFKKDLWSIFYTISNAPYDQRDQLVNEVLSFTNDSDFQYFIDMMHEYFSNPGKKGPKYIYSFYENRFSAEYMEEISNTVSTFRERLIQAH